MQHYLVNKKSWDNKQITKVPVKHLGILESGDSTHCFFCRKNAVVMVWYLSGVSGEPLGWVTGFSLPQVSKHVQELRFSVAFFFLIYLFTS